MFARLGHVLAPSWPVLAPSWSVLGRILASQNLSKIAPRGLQDASQDEVQHRPQLGGLQGPFLVEILDRSSKKKLGASNEREARWNDKHFVLFSSPLSALSLLSRYRYSIASPRSAWYCMPALRALRSLRSLARSRAPTGTKMLPRDAPKTRQDASKTPQGAPRSPPRHPKNASKTPPSCAKTLQDAPKTPQDASKRLQDASKMPRDAPKRPPGPPGDPSGTPRGAKNH